MLDFDTYKNKLPYATRKAQPALHEAYCRENARLEAKFKADALYDVGLAGPKGQHPKADKAFALAWEHGHSSGHHKVYGFLQDLAELLED